MLQNILNEFAHCRIKYERCGVLKGVYGWRQNQYTCRCRSLCIRKTVYCAGIRNVLHALESRMYSGGKRERALMHELPGLHGAQGRLCRGLTIAQRFTIYEDQEHILFFWYLLSIPCNRVLNKHHARVQSWCLSLQGRAMQGWRLITCNQSPRKIRVINPACM